MRIGRSSNFPGGFLIIFITFWVGMLALFDGIILSQVFRERHARQSFAQTQGVIVCSEIVRNQGSDGPTYSAEIQYRFEVGGRSFEGDRYAYTAWSSSDRGHARKIVERHPVGSGVVVHYDPADPAESVLDVTGNAFPRLLFIFLIPFHCLPAAAGYVVLSGLIRRVFGRTGDRDVVSRSPDRTVLRIHRFSPVLMGIAGVGLSAFVLVFVVAFGLGTMNPGAAVLRVCFMVIGSAGVGGFVLGWWLGTRTANRITVDRMSNEVRIGDHHPVSLADVASVDFLPASGIESSHGSLGLRTADGSFLKIRQSTEDESHGSLAAALRTALGLPAPTPP
jgi:hypothetical protein